MGLAVLFSLKGIIGDAGKVKGGKDSMQTKVGA